MFFNFLFFLDHSSPQSMKTTQSSKIWHTGLQVFQELGESRTTEKGNNYILLAADWQPEPLWYQKEVPTNHSDKPATFSPESYCTAQLSFLASDSTPPPPSAHTHTRESLWSNKPSGIPYPAWWRRGIRACGSANISLYKVRQGGCRLAKSKPSLLKILTHLTTSEKPSRELNLTTLPPPPEELLAKQPELKLPNLPGEGGGSCFLLTESPSTTSEKSPS
jgi:hypothetical protein